jgi:hypothetical protein
MGSVLVDVSLVYARKWAFGSVGTGLALGRAVGVTCLRCLGFRGNLNAFPRRRRLWIQRATLGEKP